MTRLEFAEIMAYITAAVNKPLTDEASEVYFDLLGDLSVEALKVAAKRVVLEHRWATFPSVAELREAAAKTLRGQVSDLSPAEAWALAWKAAGSIDLEQEGSLGRATCRLPPLVVEAMVTFGIPALCYGKEPVGVVRGQFIKIYEQLQARDQRAALLPGSVKREIATIGSMPKELPPPVRGLLDDIGQGVTQ